MAFADSDEMRSTIRSIAIVSKWYAALQVAVEGWLECQFEDPIIDELLLDPALAQYRDRLRRFRNVIYHYQPEEIMDKRASDFLRDSEITFPWAQLVHQEFKRVVWDVTHPAGIEIELQNEIAEAIGHLLGWMPSDIAEARFHRGTEKCLEYTQKVLAAGSRDTPHGQALLAAVEDLRSETGRARLNVARTRRLVIDCLKERRSITTINRDGN